MAAVVLVAAPASGQGKTTVACALARLHARRGACVRAFKCGPDFLDPQWLALASGHPVDPLDLWINGPADCAARLARAAAGADLVVVEGVMGLYDGEPSAADLALRFGLPVLAVVDASKMAGTFGALVHGLRRWRDVPWAGVLANRVGGERHAAMLRESLAPDEGWAGALPADAGITLPERHLGLTAAGELPDALARLDAAADALATTPLGARTAADWPQWVPPVVAAPGAPRRLLQGRRIAVARDAAFAFIYPANLQTLHALGAETVFFSPLAGDALPACDAVWLPGGYPELHAQALAARTDLAAQLAAHVAADRPVWAECGGLMALAETLVDGQGRVHRLWGLLPGSAVLGRRVAALGPHRLVFGGGELRGHSFHWSRFETGLVPTLHTEPARTAGGRLPPGEAVYERGALKASWFHPWFASSPELAARLFSPGGLV
ncbi:cobyrinate a,c-diamide synthase [Rubrivivax gelatinosus]|uniref:Hydrogenobyrinic acid a,c-diamide synthase (Glutamine-hydrolysing) /cobyrinate a,c-diamide synthase n=1 Tax=Rubrivivax gelatinosus TaxID=28068 RepID=A0A4R2MIY6_RUBGE|nr:cobyrinate a,c-diamide synthase [Rubrivivax gelatinosus]MBK1688557.1 cobyrinic acid a,c-diamide synthase [Rubrivivax gelatinosus]TCP04674.1 hydrogenobyrinic acid a,c-diamide synthase (glutamine-hydrolysing) /cobyrinate a,c-diamide synthase [Rubrivivax gelatinosus]